MTLPNRTRSTVRGVGTAPIEMRYAVGARAAVLAVGLSGCDPVLNIAGAHFPAWLVCMLAGALGAALLWLLFLAVRIDAYLWPRPLDTRASPYSSVINISCLSHIWGYPMTPDSSPPRSRAA